ncbi:hypothetical protein [Namhaeicola litoreus]|uniref:Uncharacterized protein n=1 Tax=Namhaeicola litoreus TaxID=1052145 RepID=A0ABW3Y281_9FLAO
MLKYIDEVSPHQILWLFKHIPLLERSLLYPEYTLQLLIEDLERMAWFKGYLDICMLFNDIDLNKNNLHLFIQDLTFLYNLLAPEVAVSPKQVKRCSSFAHFCFL